MAELNITGLSELQRFMESLPAKIEANIMRGALRYGIKRILNEAKAKCPVGKPSSEGAKKYKLYAGALRDSIRITTKRKGGRVSASIKAGGKLKNGADVNYAHIIEFTGAKPHPITAKKGHALAIGVGKYTSVQHPGMDAKPFMRPALDSQAIAAVVDVGEYIKKRLATKEGLDTSEVMIEGDE